MIRQDGRIVAEHDRVRIVCIDPTNNYNPKSKLVSLVAKRLNIWIQIFDQEETFGRS